MATVAILGILTTDISSSSNLLSPKGEVQIRFKPVTLGAYHAYILVTDSNGNKTYYRGGPRNQKPWILTLRLGLLAVNSVSRSNLNGLYSPWGTIVTQFDNYDERSPDYETGNPPSVEVNTNGQSLFLLKMKFATNLNIINSEMIPYDPLTKNSNATAYDTLKKAGLNPGSPPVWAPGWDVSLP